MFGYVWQHREVERHGLGTLRRHAANHHVRPHGATDLHLSVRRLRCLERLFVVSEIENQKARCCNHSGSLESYIEGAIRTLLKAVFSI
jgi:hypothetical protein